MNSLSGDALQQIQNRVQDSITDLDLEKYLGKGIQKKIYKYADLEKYTFKKLLPKKRDYIIILIEEEVNKGHWVVLTKDINIKQVTWFDSYGIRPSGELRFNTAEVNRQLGNEPYDITKILDEAVNSGYDVIYNKKRFQSSKQDINTCGRHCLFYILSFINKHMGLNEYVNWMDSLEKQSGLNADQVVAAIII